MDELYLKEMSARDIVDLKLVYESTKHFYNQMLEMRSVLVNQYIPLKNDHKIRFRLGILSKKDKAKFSEIVESLSTLNSRLWKSPALTIDSSSFLFIDIHYNFNGKDIYTQLGGEPTAVPFSFINVFMTMVGEIKIEFDLYFASYDLFPCDSGFDLSVFDQTLSTYLPVAHNFLSVIDEEDLNKRFAEALPMVEKSNKAREDKAKEKAAALENITNILNADLVPFVREKAGIDYPESLIIEALETIFK